MLSASRTSRSSTAVALHHALVLGLAAAALAVAAYALARGLANRVGLEVLYGTWIRLLLGCLALGVLLAALGLLRTGSAWLRGAWRETSLRTFRAAFCAAVLGAAAYLAFFQPFERLTFDLAAGLCLSAFAAWLAVSAPFAGGPPSRGARALDFALFNGCLVVLGLEVVLRVYAGLVPSEILAREDGDAVRRIAEHRLLPGDLHLGLPHNSRGYYDEEFSPPGTPRRVVAISDSFGFGIVPHHYHYTTVAERILGDVEVDNLDVPSIGPPEYLHLLRTEALPLDPDLVVIVIFLGNDVAFAGHEAPRLDAWLRSWFDRRNLLVTTAVERRQVLAQERARLAEQGGPIAGIWGGDAPATGRIEGPAALAAAFPWIEDPMLEKGGMSSESYLAVELSRARDLCAETRSFYRPFFEAMAEIQRAAGDTPLAVLLIPDECQVEEPVWAEVVQGLSRLTLERDRPQRWVGEWLAEREIPFVDLLPRMLVVEPLADGRRHLYHLRDTHFNRRGCDVAGRGLADLIRLCFESRPRR